MRSCNQPRLAVRRSSCCVQRTKFTGQWDLKSCCCWPTLSWASAFHMFKESSYFSHHLILPQGRGWTTYFPPSQETSLSISMIVTLERIPLGQAHNHLEFLSEKNSVHISPLIMPFSCCISMFYSLTGITSFDHRSLLLTQKPSEINSSVTARVCWLPRPPSRGLQDYIYCAICMPIVVLITAFVMFLHIQRANGCCQSD